MSHVRDVRGRRAGEAMTMCLGIPGQVVEVVEGYDGQLALVDVQGTRRRVNIAMLEDEHVSSGDWVLIHMGFAMNRIDELEAREVLAGLELVGRAADGSDRDEGPGPPPGADRAPRGADG